MRQKPLYPYMPYSSATSISALEQTPLSIMHAACTKLRAAYHSSFAYRSNGYLFGYQSGRGISVSLASVLDAI